MAFTLNLRKLLKNEAGPQNGKAELDLASRDFPGYAVEKPVSAAYTATREGAGLRLALTAAATLSALCARCLEPVEQGWTLERELLIRPTDLDEEFPELPIAPDGTLDLEDLVYEELVMDAPPVLLCREDCLGLCQTCGKPQASCGCKGDPQGDPRLQVLKQLLSDDPEQSE